MIYLLLFLAATAILLYITSRWLRAELRELGAWLHEKWTVLRGGQSTERLVADTRTVFEREGLNAQFLVISRQVMSCYKRLQRDHLDTPAAEPLPAAVVLALAADLDARRLYLRAVISEHDAPGRDVGRFLDFDDVLSLEPVPARLPAGPAPAAERALEIRTRNPQDPPFHLALEPDWGIEGNELVERIRAMLEGRWRPEGIPVVVR